MRNENNKKIRTSYSPLKNELLFFYIYYGLLFLFSWALIHYIENPNQTTFYSIVLVILFGNLTTFFIQQKYDFFYPDLLSYITTVKKYASYTRPLLVIITIIFIYIMYNFYLIWGTDLLYNVVLIYGLSFILEVSNKIFILKYLGKNINEN
jgi:hypothetical protein